ncbi:unnamed protein product [Enterobius vermicularis]|uniref:Alkaline ceramidase n=1 Tax=Enterobius vermicularis TaxID=51028 RepID=A0A0N4VAX4_ENTVE|nr:unnamed protein product [Enterobius vermicularis]
MPLKSDDATFGMPKSVHDYGLPWSATVVLTGVVLRILASPTHIFAEKLYAKQTVTVGFLRRQLIKKFADHYKIGIVASGDRYKLDTIDERLLKKCNTLVGEYVQKYMSEHRLGTARILNLRISVMPLWFFASLSLRSIIISNLYTLDIGEEAPFGMNGSLWFPDLLQPDPLYILPLTVGLLGFSNLYLSKRLYPTEVGESIRTIFFTVITLTITAVLLKAPAVSFFSFIILKNVDFKFPQRKNLLKFFSLYWSVVGLTALVETHLLRTSSFKKLFGIPPLSTDLPGLFGNFFVRSRNERNCDSRSLVEGLTLSIAICGDEDYDCYLSVTTENFSLLHCPTENFTLREASVVFCIGSSVKYLVKFFTGEI